MKKSYKKRRNSRRQIRRGGASPDNKIAEYTKRKNERTNAQRKIEREINDAIEEEEDITKLEAVIAKAKKHNLGGNHIVDIEHAEAKLNTLREGMETEAETEWSLCLEETNVHAQEPYVHAQAESIKEAKVKGMYLQNKRDTEGVQINDKQRNLIKDYKLLVRAFDEGKTAAKVAMDKVSKRRKAREQEKAAAAAERHDSGRDEEEEEEEAKAAAEAAAEKEWARGLTGEDVYAVATTIDEANFKKSYLEAKIRKKESNDGYFMPRDDKLLCLVKDYEQLLELLKEGVTKDDMDQVRERRKEINRQLAEKEKNEKARKVKREEKKAVWAALADDDLWYFRVFDKDPEENNRTAIYLAQHNIDFMTFNELLTEQQNMQNHNPKDTEITLHTSLKNKIDEAVRTRKVRNTKNKKYDAENSTLCNLIQRLGYENCIYHSYQKSTLDALKKQKESELIIKGEPGEEGWRDRGKCLHWCPADDDRNYERKDETYDPLYKIGELTNLKKIILKNHSYIESLPTSISNLTNLEEIEVENCEEFRDNKNYKLKALPNTIGNLTNLKKFVLKYENISDRDERFKYERRREFGDDSGIKEIPESFGNLTNLKTLKLEYCIYLKELLPDSLQYLTKLTDFSLKGCEELPNLPETLGNLTNLTTLNLRHCKKLTNLPNSLGKLNKLTTLNLSYCESLATLPTTTPDQLQTLTELNLLKCKSLTTLPDSFGQLQALPELILEGCEKLTKLPESLGKLNKLTTLHLYGCTSLTELPKSLGDLKTLKTLNLSYCESLKTLPNTIGNLKTLTTLNLSYCKSLATLPTTTPDQLQALTELNLFRCIFLTALPETLGDLKTLTTLKLSYCISLETLPNTIGNLRNLKTLNLQQCEKLTNLPETLGNLTNLETLNLQHCLFLEQLPQSLGVLGNLKTINRSECISLKYPPLEKTTTNAFGIKSTTRIETAEQIKNYLKKHNPPLKKHNPPP